MEVEVVLTFFLSNLEPALLCHIYKLANTYLELSFFETIGFCRFCLVFCISVFCNLLPIFGNLKIILSSKK
jgi:hypothetical protein